MSRDQEILDNIEFENFENHKTAGPGKRLANLLLDIVFYYIFCFIIGILLTVVLMIVSPSSLAKIQFDNKVVDYLFGIILMFIYYTFFEFRSGRTIAKYITKTKVVSIDGSKPNLSSILKRSLWRLVPFDTFSFIFGDATEGWHDKYSRTKVIEL